MRYLLNRVCGQGSTLENFLDHMADMNLATNPRDTIRPSKIGDISIGLRHFIEDPDGLCNEFFSFIAKAPNELSQQAATYIKANKEVNAFGAEAYVGTELAMYVSDVGKSLDEFTKSLAKITPWRIAYHSAVDVIRIWRTKEDEVVGLPEHRKVQIEAVSTRLVSIVSAEQDNGRSQTMLSVSNGLYKGEEAVREDYLIDIPEIFNIAYGQSRVGAPRGVNQDVATAVLYRSISAAMPLILKIMSMATMLSELNALDDPTGIYTKAVSKARKLLDPKDSPNALIDIGGWA